MVIFPLAPDQTIAQMWSNGARGGDNLSVYVLQLLKNYKVYILMDLQTLIDKSGLDLYTNMAKNHNKQ